jgi:hypothetical protein
MSAMVYLSWRTFHNLPENPFSTAPDAAVAGFSGSVVLGKVAFRLFGRSTLGHGIAAAFAMAQIMGGGDIIVPFASPRAWLYGYWGANFGLDEADWRDSSYTSWSGYVGLMWSLKQASDYEGPFFCTSLTTSSLNVSRWGFPVTPNLQLCSSGNKESPGTYGFTVNVAGRSSTARIQASYTRYTFLDSISGAPIPPVSASYGSVNNLWNNLVGGR